MKRDKLAGSLKALKAHRAAQGDTPPAPTTTAPAITSVAESVRRLSAAATQDIPASEIQESRFTDRLDVEDGLEDLVESIRRSGQQLPVLLRRSPNDAPQDKPYEVIYGRRRIAACRRLGRPVRAYISVFNDRQALVAQGLENAARLETSFIERARFAMQLEAAGCSTVDICETLSIDPSSLSRMRSVIRSIPEAVIQAIGPAHRAGRRPWLRLGELLGSGTSPDAEAVLALTDPSRPSDERLTTVVAALEGTRPKPKPKSAPALQRTTGGKRLALSVDARRMTVQVKDRRAADFLPWLEGRIDDLYAEWSAGKTGVPDD